MQCGRASIYEDQKSLPDAWSWTDQVVFVIPEGKDVIGKNFQLQLTHDLSFKYQNVYLEVITTHQLDTSRQLITFELTDGAGRWIGEKKGNHRQVSYELNIGEISPQRLIVRQYSRETELTGLRKLSIVLH